MLAIISIFYSYFTKAQIVAGIDNYGIKIYHTSFPDIHICGALVLKYYTTGVCAEAMS